MKRVTQRSFSTVLVALLACSCAHNSRNPDTSHDAPGISVTSKAMERDRHSGAAWLAYGIASATFQGDQQPRDGFAREVHARTAAAKVWRELKQKNTVRPNSDLDALASVELSGFMREYVWHYLKRPDWNEPQQLRMSEFLAWKNAHLQSHTPVVDPGVRSSDPK